MDRKKQVLVYGFGERQAVLCQLLKTLGAEPVPVSPEQCGETLGCLCGLKGYAPSGKPPKAVPEGPVLIFHDFSQKELDGTLEAVSGSGLARDSLKAVMTPTNQNWRFDKLASEIQQEHQVMGELIELKKYRSRIVTLDPGNLPLMKAVIQAEMLLSGQREVHPGEAEKALRELQKAFEG